MRTVRGSTCAERLVGMDSRRSGGLVDGRMGLSVDDRGGVDGTGGHRKDGGVRAGGRLRDEHRPHELPEGVDVYVAEGGGQLRDHPAVPLR
eukprot:442688-Prorocentrum_minimum.AAC.3